MFRYKISIDKKIISILGPHLYGDTATIIAELISNSRDASADNCWVTIKTSDEPEIIIEDDGEGMTPREVNKYFLDIGYDRRKERPKNSKGEDVFGRKGIGKLAAFSLSKRIELYSLKNGKKAGCILDYDKITKQNKNPEAIPNKDIVFKSEKLSKNGSGTRLVMKLIQKDIRTTYYYLINKISRNFNLDKFKIHIAKNEEEPMKVSYTNLKFFDNMDTIVTIGSEYRKISDEVRKNKIPLKFKNIVCYDDSEDRKIKLQMDKKIEVLDKIGKKKEIKFVFRGWIGTVEKTEHLKSLIIKGGASKEEEESISMSDNRITIFSRKRIGEYDVLPKVQTNTLYDSYVIGEIHVDIFEDDNLIDMAISNRKGYEESDSRYRALIENLKILINYLVARKREIQERRKAEKEKEESDKIRKDFSGSQTMKILRKHLEKEEQNVVSNDQLQFMRAVRLAQNTRQVLISSNHENKEYGFFILKIFELLHVDLGKTFIFTSNSATGVPHGVNIYDYLKDCFRDDIYLIFLFSRHFYDSNVCISETGAAWATNKNHTNIVIDVGFSDIDRPIDNAELGLVINDITKLDEAEFVKFVKTVYGHIGSPAPQDSIILQAIQGAVTIFKGKLNTDKFYPKRKYQGHPVCSKCSNTMVLKNSGNNPYYKCRTPSCGNKIKADIY